MQGDKLRGRKRLRLLSVAEASAFKNLALEENLGGLYYDVPPIGCVVR